MAYDRIEPIGDRRLDLLVGHLAYNIYHAVRLTGTKMENLGPEEFVPKWETKEQEEEPESDLPVAPEQVGLASKILSAFGLKAPPPKKR